MSGIPGHVAYRHAAMSSTIGIRPPRFYGKLFMAFELFGDLCCSELELRET